METDYLQSSNDSVNDVDILQKSYLPNEKNEIFNSGDNINWNIILNNKTNFENGESDKNNVENIREEYEMTQGNANVNNISVNFLENSINSKKLQNEYFKPFMKNSNGFLHKTKKFELDEFNLNEFFSYCETKQENNNYSMTVENDYAVAEDDEKSNNGNFTIIRECDKTNEIQELYTPELFNINYQNVNNNFHTRKNINFESQFVTQPPTTVSSHFNDVNELPQKLIIENDEINDFPNENFEKLNSLDEELYRLLESIEKQENDETNNGRLNFKSFIHMKQVVC